MLTHERKHWFLVSCLLVIEHPDYDQEIENPMSSKKPTQDLQVP
jgi:hypothetical protein